MSQTKLRLINTTVSIDTEEVAVRELEVVVSEWEIASRAINDAMAFMDVGLVMKARDALLEATQTSARLRADLERIPA